MQPIALEVVRVRIPCTVPWESMRGDDRVRFCGECNLHVHNISALTDTEVADLVAETRGRLCVCYFERPDGTILTEKCPRALRAIRNGFRWAAARVASWCGLGLALAGGCLRTTVGVCVISDRPSTTSPATRQVAANRPENDRVIGGTDSARLAQFAQAQERKIKMLKARSDECARLQKYDEAIALLKQVLAIDPNDDLAQWKLAVLSDYSPTCGNQ